MLEICRGKQPILYVQMLCFSLSYLACSAHAPYCHVETARFFRILNHYILLGTIFEKKKFIEHKMCVSIFSTKFARNISDSNRND